MFCKTCGVSVLVSLALCASGTSALAEETLPAIARSPDGKSTITLRSGSGQDARRLLLEVARDGQQILQPARVSVRLDGDRDLADGSQFQEVRQGTVDETFALLWGKTDVVRNRGSWTLVRLVSAGGLNWEIELRAYDDGVAYRYVLPEQDRLRDFVLVDESTEYRFAKQPMIHYTTCKDFKTDHETQYERRPLDQLPRQTLIDLPVLAVWPDGSAAAITEARIRDFAGMYLERIDERDVVLRSRLSPLPGRRDACVTGRTPHGSPWRVVLLGDHAGRLIESNLLVCLNDERPQGDYSWVRPGKTTWHWWNGTAEKGLPFKMGMNFATHKYYIDFCARHGIAYHAVVADERPWYVQSKPTFGPHPDTDILTPRPELELPRILDYARQQGVGIRLWVHWKPLGQRLEEAFTQYEAWGISGLMVDFLDRDDQEIVNYCERVLRSAAQHKLHIQFHGSYKPSGEQRTFPHLFNREGVLNLEYLKWSKLCTPAHDVAVAYTRLLAGPLDYHLGGFHAASRKQFVPRHANPSVYGTRCHQLAMYVVFENPMPMVCDTPSAYEGQTGFDFLTAVPTTWDETRFVTGEPSEYVVLARRKDQTWYLGGLTDWTARKVEVPLAFLGGGDYAASLYVDGSLDEEQPNAVRIEQPTATAAKTLSIEMASGGGFTAVLSPK